MQKTKYQNRDPQLETSGKIVEDSPKDDYWGWGEKRDGRNELGKIWMRLRDEI